MSTDILRKPRRRNDRAYAKRDDLASVGLGPRAMGATDPLAIEDAIWKASALADSFIMRHYILPLKQWGDDLTLAVASIAAFYAMKGVGFNPDAAHDQLLVKSHDDAVAWLRLIGDGLALLAPPAEDSSADEERPTIGQHRVVF